MIPRNSDGTPMTIAQALANFKPTANLKNPNQRKMEETILGVTTNAISLSDKIDITDTDNLLIILLLSKIPFPTLKTKLYRIAKKMDIQTKARSKKEIKDTEYFDEDIDEYFDPSRWDSI